MSDIEELISLAPANHAFAVTPHDTNPIAHVSRWLYVGGAGALKLTLDSGDVVTFGAVSAGSLIPIRASIVWSAGTAATHIVALY
jgi:hypothetical protein